MVAALVPMMNDKKFNLSQFNCFNWQCLSAVKNLLVYRQQMVAEPLLFGLLAQRPGVQLVSIFKKKFFI
jgi:hypothetical protein